MPYVLAFNRPAIEGPVAALARYMEIGTSFDDYLAAVTALGARVGIPRRITDIGVSRADFQRLATMALPDFNAGCNPRTLDVPALVSILEDAAA
jgi:alcohol dehydrogenase class IV